VPRLLGAGRFLVILIAMTTGKIGYGFLKGDIKELKLSGLMRLMAVLSRIPLAPAFPPRADEGSLDWKQVSLLPVEESVVWFVGIALDYTAHYGDAARVMTLWRWE